MPKGRIKKDVPPPETICAASLEPRKYDKRALNTPCTKARSEMIENREYIPNAIEYAVAVANLAKEVNPNDINTLRAAFYKYVDMAHKMQAPINNISAYAAMGLNLATASVWKREGAPEKRKLLAEVDSVCSIFRNMMVETGKINVVWGIFTAKNFDHMTDQQTVNIAPVNPMGEQQDAATISAKYEALPDD